MQADNVLFVLLAVRDCTHHGLLVVPLLSYRCRMTPRATRATEGAPIDAIRTTGHKDWNTNSACVYGIDRFFSTLSTPAVANLPTIWQRYVVVRNWSHTVDRSVNRRICCVGKSLTLPPRCGRLVHFLMDVMNEYQSGTRSFTRELIEPMFPCFGSFVDPFGEQKR